jgi:hypothetical protein
MSSNTRNITAESMFSCMTPTTLVSLIADLDEYSAIARTAEKRTVASLITMAMEALYATIGSSEAIQMLAEAEVSASNPTIERIVDEWLEIDAEPTEEDEAAAIEKARRGEPTTWQIWQDRTSGEQWAAEIENGIAVGGYGPLTLEEAAQLKACPRDWECDADSETAAWLNETTDDYRVVWPYISG